MTKRILIMTLSAVAFALLAGNALAGKPAVLFPGGTYLNQAATTGLSCLGGTAAASGTTTFVVSVPSFQSGQGVTLQLDYTFDPDDATLPDFSGGVAVRVQANPAVAVQTIPIAIPVSSGDGTTATVVNTTVLSIASDGTLLFDAASLGAWSCGTPPSATSTGGSGSGGGGGCVAGYTALLDSLAGVKNDLKNKVVESQKECLKGKYKEARHKLDDFIRQALKSHLDAASVTSWVDQARTIRDSLPLA
jgi:hypothetical protein